jgi:endonuclease YncB( thermonuclease family)
MFTYAAVVERVIDPDGLGLAVDLGFDTWHRGSFRLLGCNARELSQLGGREAAANLAALLPVGTQVTIRSVKPDKFGGRYLAVVTLPDGSDLVSTLIAEGWAAAWNGTGTKPVPPWPRSP